MVGRLTLKSIFLIFLFALAVRNSPAQQEEQRPVDLVAAAKAMGATPAQQQQIDWDKAAAEFGGKSASAPGKTAPSAKRQVVPHRVDIPTIAKTSKGAIVTIVMGDDDKAIALGTGFLVRADGAIVTNYHVIATGKVAAVKFADGTVLQVDGVLAADQVRDLAVIKVHGKTFRTLTLGNSDQIQVGEEVVAIGNPLGLELTVSNGILSGVRRGEKEGGKLLQITAPISHGSSGGPLFNTFGEVIGINAIILEGGENLNFAIPVNDAKNLLSNKSATLQNLPDETLHDDAEDSKPEKRQELGWLNSERYVTPAFSALYPRRKLEDPDVYCATQNYERIDDHEFVGMLCQQQIEGAVAAIAYADVPFEPNDSPDKVLYRIIHAGVLVNPIELSTNVSASINQDQSFAAMRPIAALESTAKGVFDGVPVKLCARAGYQGRRLWILTVLAADSTGHTKKECDAFFDSVVVK